jgi:hypothetical protein
VQSFYHAIKYNPKVQFECTVQTTNKAEQEILDKEGPKKLTPFHAVYLLNVAEPSVGLWQRLRAYIEDGGNLGVIPPGGGAKDSTLAAYNTSEAQAVLPGTPAGKITAAPEKIGLNNFQGAKWNWDDKALDYHHPFLKPFGDWKLRGNVDFMVTPPWVNFFWKFEPHKDKDVAVLVRYWCEKVKANEQPAMLEHTFGKGRGRVVLLTTPAHDPASAETPWNNFMEKGNVNSWRMVLPGELSVYLAGDPERLILNFITGRGAPLVTIPPGIGDVPFTLHGPTGSDIKKRADKDNVLTWHKADAPGNYTVAAGTQNEFAAFSVNLPAEEGLLQRVPVADIENLFGKDAVRNFKPGDTFIEVMQGVLSRPEELFPMLMLALLLLLALENLLANLFYRREPKTAEPGVES